MNQEEMVWCPIKRFNPGAFNKPGPGFPAPYGEESQFTILVPFKHKLICTKK
jgi:hypothetical protein